MFIIRYSIAICDLAFKFSSYLFTVEYVYAAAQHVTRIEMREVEYHRHHEY